MSSPRSNVLPSLALALLLGASILAVQPTAAYPVSPSQSQSLADVLGDGAPFEDWQTRIQTSQFYLTSNATTTTTQAGAVPFVVGTPPGAGLQMDIPTTEVSALPVVPRTQPYALAQPDPDDRQVLIGLDATAPVAIKARFEMTPATVPVDTVTVYEVGASVRAACDARALSPGVAVDGGTTQRPGGIRAHIDLEHLSNGAWSVVRTLTNDNDGNALLMLRAPATTAPEVIATFTNANIVLGSPQLGNGVKLEPQVDRLVLRLELPSGVGAQLVAGQCMLHYGSVNYPSALITKDDSARVATLTTDLDGNHVTGFASAQTTDSNNRQLIVHSLQANPWGNSARQQITYETNVRLREASSSDYLYYVEDFNDELPLERDITVIELVSRSDDTVTPTLIDRKFRFQYPANFEDNQIQIETYTEGQGWEVQGSLFRVGGRGFTFELAPGQERTHLVNPREPTQFTFLVRNTGSEDDVISVTATDPGSGWLSEVLGGGQVFLRPGGRALVAIEVTPPASAGAGTTQSLVVQASSSFSDVGDSEPESVTVQVTNEVIRKVDLSGANAIEVRPGVQKALAVTVTNLGTARDSFVILPSLPANLPGWTVVMNPTSLQIPSGASAQVNALITAPSESLNGQTLTLGLTVVEVGDSTVSDRVDVAVRVFSVTSLLADLVDRTVNRTMRTIGPEPCLDQTTPLCAGPVDGPDPVGNVATDGTATSDEDFDRTSLFRVLAVNPGDQPLPVTIEAFWDKTDGGFIDASTCEGGLVTPVISLAGDPRDGVPDGWRFNYGAAIGSEVPANPQTGRNAYSGFSGLTQIHEGPFVIPARSTREVYVEVGYIAGLDGCPNNTAVDDDPFSPKATLGILMTSLNDPTLKSIVGLKAVREAPGAWQSVNRYAGATHEVGIEPVLGETTTKALQPTQTATYNLRATNKGNEEDDLILRASGSPGWRHTLQVTGSVPSEIDCQTGTDGTVRCTDVGIYDEVLFRVIATPPVGARPGDRDDLTVTVASGDAGGIAAAQALRARIAGTFAYEAGPLGNGTRDGNPGRTLALPFSIENIGTEADTFVATLTQGDAKWTPVLSTGAGMFLPALTDGAGYLSVTIPEDATLNQAKQFRIQVTSTEGNQIRTFDLFARPVAPGRLTLTSEEGADVLLPTRGVAVPIDIKALLVTGDEVPVTVSVDTLGLPEGWIVTPSSRTLDLVADSNGRPAGTARFSVTAPSDALATTRAILRVSGTSSAESALKAATDVTLNLASTFGLELNGTALNQTIAPGGDVIYDLRIANRGLGADTVRFTHTALPADWTMLVNPGSISLGPLQEKNFTVKLSAPVSAEPKDIASVLLFATSVGDPTTLDSIPLLATIGYNELKATLTTAEAYASPQETLVYVVNVTNTGTLPDLVKVSGQIDPPGLVRHIAGNVTPAQFEILPGATVQVRFDQRLGDRIPSGSIVNGTAIFTSLLDERSEPATARVATRGHVLPYALLDLNGDTVPEYAVDRDRDASNGLEQFQASKTSGAVGLRVPDLQKFLRDESREDKSRDVVLANGTTQRVLVYSAVDHCEGANVDSPVGIIDGDCDGKADHFLDMDGDDLPDLYWDPDINKGSRIEFRKDINGDQVPESFVDVNGEGRLDAVFDLTRGAFTPVLNLDADGDGELDYVVDKNGNGQVDQDETVLYTRTGSLLIVQKVDVDGDDKLDQVFDTDGDGNPDYFIPSGSKESVAISLRDVNGDGVQDWTFDGDGDGRKESYYDPATGEAHVISAAGHFVDALKKYWYIGALFGLVVVLFAALVLVTRR